MGLTSRKRGSGKKNGLDPKLIIWGWGYIEADFQREYRLDLNELIFGRQITLRRFMILLRGLSGRSAWASYAGDDKNKSLAQDYDNLNKINL